MSAPDRTPEELAQLEQCAVAALQHPDVQLDSWEGPLNMAEQTAVNAVGAYIRSLPGGACVSKYRDTTRPLLASCYRLIYRLGTLPRQRDAKPVFNNAASAAFAQYLQTRGSTP